MAGFTNAPAYTNGTGDVFCADTGVNLGGLSDIDTRWDNGDRIVEADLDGYRRWYPLVEKPEA